MCHDTSCDRRKDYVCFVSIKTIKQHKKGHSKHKFLMEGRKHPDNPHPGDGPQRV